MVDGCRKGHCRRSGRCRGRRGRRTRQHRRDIRHKEGHRQQPARRRSSAGIQVCTRHSFVLHDLEPAIGVGRIPKDTDVETGTRGQADGALDFGAGETVVRGLLETEHLLQEGLFAQVVRRDRDNLRRDPIAFRAHGLGLALLFEEHEVDAVRSRQVHLIDHHAVGLETTDRRAETIACGGKLGVARRQVAHRDVDALRYPIRGSRPLAHRPTR